jgi:hypothetical protein
MSICTINVIPVNCRIGYAALHRDSDRAALGTPGTDGPDPWTGDWPALNSTSWSSSPHAKLRNPNDAGKSTNSTSGQQIYGRAIGGKRRVTDAKGIQSGEGPPWLLLSASVLWAAIIGFTMWHC